jgi:hypothetical protein
MENQLAANIAPKPMLLPSTLAQNLKESFPGFQPRCKSGSANRATAGGELGLACDDCAGARNIKRLWIMAGSPSSDDYRRTRGVLKP